MSAVHPPTAGSSAEAQAEAFASDPRIYFSKETNTWLFEDDNGQEMEYDTSKGAWVPVVGDTRLVQAFARKNTSTAG